VPLLQRWGPARVAQVLGLWTFLGDGNTRPVSTSALQVWGPAGVGKTDIVFDFLTSLSIAHVRLNCACMASLGELHMRIAEQLRRLAAHIAQIEAVLPVPKELAHPISPLSQLRALDRLEAAVKVPLDFLAAADVITKLGRVAVVLDNAQELQAPRFGANAIHRLITLPQVLRHRDRLAVVTVSRLPLSSLGLLPARDPPAVAFQPYTAAETGELLLAALSKLAAPEGDGADAAAAPAPSPAELRTLCGSGLMKFAAPYVGCNLRQLLRIGEEVLRSPGGAGGSMANLQEQIEKALQQRISLPDPRGLLESEPAGAQRTAAATWTAVTKQQMTRAELRLIVSAYLGAHIDKDDDVQLFCPRAKRKRRMMVKRAPRAEAQLPVFAQAPRPVPLARLFAIYHHFAGQPQLLGPMLFASLTRLCEAGLLSYAGGRSTTPNIEQDQKIICRTELPLVQECAGELHVDLAEYICN